MDLHREFDQDILVSEVGLLNAVMVSVDAQYPLWSCHSPFSRELALFESRHEAGRQSVCLQTEASLAAPRYIEYEGNSPLILGALIEVLVLDKVLVDKVAHARADVPAHVLRIGVDLAQKFDHLILVSDTALCAGGGGGEGGGILLVVWVRRGRRVWCGRGKGERVGDLQLRALVEAEQKSSAGCGKCRSRVFDDAHRHQRLDLHLLQRRVLVDIDFRHFCCVSALGEGECFFCRNVGNVVSWWPRFRVWGSSCLMATVNA